MVWRIYWAPGKPWAPKPPEPISEQTAMMVVRHFWGREWDSEPTGRSVKIDWEDVSYLKGLSDGGDPQTHEDVEALMDALFVYGEVTLELRQEEGPADAPDI